MTNAVTQPAPQIERDRYGRPLVIPPGGGKKISYRRVTTFIDVLDDRFALELWKQRQVAHGMAMRPDLVLKAASAAGDKKLLNEVVKDASEAAGSTQAATVGTALHAITEQLDRGEDPLIPPSTQPDVDAYKRTTEHLSMRMIEVFVVHDGLQVGGTFDRVVELDGVNYVADIKTGSIDWGGGKISMQLALYSRSQLYDVRSGQRTPLDVDTTRGLVIHLPAGAGECQLKWADLSIGWSGVEIAKDVWDWRGLSGQLEASKPGLLDPGGIATLSDEWECIDPDGHDGEECDCFHFHLLDLIASASNRESLESLFHRYNTQWWTPQHTAAAKARLAQLSSPAPAA